MKFNYKKKDNISSEMHIGSHRKHLFDKTKAQLILTMKPSKTSSKQSRLESEKRTKLTFKNIGSSFANLFKINQKKPSRIFEANIYQDSRNKDTSILSINRISAKSCSDIFKVNNELDFFAVPMEVYMSSESLQKDVKTPVKRRQPAMGVSAYSLKARKSQNTLSVENNGLQRRFATNPNLKEAKFRSTHNVNQMQSNCMLNYETENDHMFQSEVQSQEFADIISISMIKHRRMHSASILCSSLRGFSTDV